MEVYIPAGCGMSGRVAGGDDRVQNPAGAMGEGADPDRKENFAASAEKRSTVSGEAGGLVSPHREYELSADGGAFGAAAAGHGDPVLPGLVSDVVYRYPTFSGFYFFDFKFLPGVAA